MGALKISALEWKECELSGQLKAKGFDCEYWIYETTRNYFVLLRKPDNSDEFVKEWEGSNICCAQHADIMEANREIERCKKTMIEVQRLLRNGAAGAIIDTVWSDTRKNTTLYELLYEFKFS